jgi:hypothetical protein
MKHARAACATLAVLLLCAVAGAPRAAAQSPFDTTAARVVGQRVQVRLNPDSVVGHPQQFLYGTLSSVYADSLTLQLRAGTAPMRISAAAIDRFYASRGVPSQRESAIRGAARGALVGAAMGFVMHTLIGDGLGVIGTAALQGTLGGVVGYLLPQERWRRVKLPPP